MTPKKTTAARKVSRRAVNPRLAAIARNTLQMPTLETRNSDSLDFREVSVWSVREALELAYEAGAAAALTAIAGK